MSSKRDYHCPNSPLKLPQLVRPHLRRMEKRSGRPMQLFPQMGGKKVVMTPTNHFMAPKKRDPEVLPEVNETPKIKQRPRSAEYEERKEKRRSHPQRLEKLRRSLHDASSAGLRVPQRNDRTKLLSTTAQNGDVVEETVEVLPESAENDASRSSVDNRRNHKNSVHRMHSAKEGRVTGHQRRNEEEGDGRGGGEGGAERVKGGQTPFATVRKKSTMAFIKTGRIKRKSFFRCFKKIAKFCCILVGLWKKHVHKVHEFMQKNIQLVNVQLISDVLFDVTEFKADQQVEVALRNYPEIAAYPVRIQTKIAEKCWYERFVGRRIIVRQGHIARCFYFILSGAVLVTRMEEDSDISRTLCYLNRGDSFGELGIINRGCRQATCISEGSLELLVCSDEEYESLFLTGASQDKTSLRAIPCLDGWPVEALESNPTKVISSFFRRGTTLVRDSALSKWIYILKSGSCTVLKKLQSVEANPPPHHVRLVKSSREGRRKKEFTELSSEEYEASIRRRCDDLDRKRTRHGIQRIKDLRMGTLSHLSTRHFRKDKPKTEVQTKAEPTITKSNLTSFLDSGIGNQSQRSARSRKSESEFMDPNVKPMFPRSASDLAPDMANVVFVHVKTLTRGDVFGLTEMLHEDQPSLSLISNGAECLLIDKQFYFQHMSQELWRTLRYEISPYPSSSKIQSNLQLHVDWEEEKTRIFNKTLRLLERERDTKNSLSHLSLG